LSTLILVDDLLEKYGGGETFVRKCDTCNYEEDMRSEGVHISLMGDVFRSSLLMRSSPAQIVMHIKAFKKHMTQF
jgi:hypothetical protein